MQRHCPSQTRFLKVSTPCHPSIPSIQPSSKQTTNLIITNETGPKLLNINPEIPPFSSSVSPGYLGLLRKDHRHTSCSPARGQSPMADCCLLHTRSCSGAYSSIQKAFVHGHYRGAVWSGWGYISVV